jgi:PAS domain-containing protein
MAYTRMSTLHRLILITLIVAVFITVAVTSITHFAIQSGVRQLEQTVAMDGADHFILELRAESESIREAVYEWAVWNETRDFLQGDNPGFIERNVDSIYLEGADISRLLFYNSTGSLVSGAGLDTEQRFIQIYPDDLGRLLLSDGLIGSSGIKEPRAGLYPAGNRIVLLGIHPVTLPGDPGRNVGTVVVVRETVETSLSGMTASPGSSVRLTPVSPDERSSHVAISPEGVRVESDENTETIFAIFIVPDLLDRPGWTANLRIPFHTPYGRQMIVTLLVIIITGFGIFICAIYVIFNRFFLTHIAAIGQQLDNATFSGRFDRDVPVDLPPDIVPLAGSASRVIQSLDEKENSVIRSEKGRKSVEIRWETLFQSADEAILIGDEDGILTCNPRFVSLAGIQCEDVIGTPVSSLPFKTLVGDGTTTLQDIWDAPQGEGQRFVWRIFPGSEDLDDSPVLDANLRFVEMDGRMLRFLICRDITKEMQLHAEQELAINQIDENLGQLAALNDEIRNPLTMIAAWTELDNPPNRSKIMDGVARINAIIDRVDKGYVASEKVRKYLQKSIDGYGKDPGSP